HNTAVDSDHRSDRRSDGLSAYAQLTAGHTFEVARSTDEALRFVEATLAVVLDTTAANDGSIQGMLHDVVSAARGLKDIVVLDARGRVVHQASGSEGIGLDRTDQPYFTSFRENPALKFNMGAPVRLGSQSTLAGWLIPAARAWRKPNGELAGVIVGMLEPQLFDTAWTFDNEIAGLSIALTTANGALIMRRPFLAEVMGRPLIDGPTLSQVSRSVADTLQARSSFDGQDTLMAYRKVAAYPGLLIFVAQPMDVVLAGWRRITWIVGTIWLLASLALGGLGARLAAEMNVRGALENRYHALFDSIPYPVIVSDCDTQRVLALNSSARHQYGLGDARLTADFAVLADRRQAFSKDTASILQGQRHRNKDGTTIDVEMTVRLIEYDRRPAILTIAVDVSDRLRAERARHSAEDQLRQSQKMEVLGQLTGGIAHDFNNILMVIIDNVEALTEKDNVDRETLKRLDRIAQSTQRAEDLTRQMLAFSRKQPLRPRPTNVNDLVADTGKLLRRALGEQIEVDSVMAEDVWAVYIDRAQLETALFNLCLNARDAMPHGGRVLIETRNITLDKEYAEKVSGAASGDYVEIVVSDTGRGIPKDDLDKVFEPFFSTKAGGKGSGLGLSMVYGFIRQSNGLIEISSKVDHGTSFRLCLPRCDGAPEGMAVSRTSVPVGGAERVLVVEDDPQVRASVVRQLQSLGYVVSEAADGAAGVASFEAAEQPYELLLTDVVMPGPLNGKLLADEIVRRWPATRIVFMSGYTDNALIYEGRIAADVRLLSKPFRKSDLAKMIRSALDSDAIVNPTGT
ncbi:MAG: ATP-binding protein, partial [bacterium]|nr:ATP-binding protein [bacterium]